MKKIAAIAFVLMGIFSANVMADDTNSTDSNTDLYIGLNVFGASDSFTYSSPDGLTAQDFPYGSNKTDYSSAGFKLIFGALLVYDLRLQGYFQSEKFNKPPFDGTNERLNEFGLDLMKTFPVSKSFLPFIQGGFGYGFMENVPLKYFNSGVTEFNIKLGGGLIYKVSDSIELLGGLDLQWRRWQDLDQYTFTNIKTLETKDDSVRYYIGLNFLF